MFQWGGQAHSRLTHDTDLGAGGHQWIREGWSEQGDQKGRTRYVGSAHILGHLMTLDFILKAREHPPWDLRRGVALSYFQFQEHHSGSSSNT